MREELPCLFATSVAEGESSGSRLGASWCCAGWSDSAPRRWGWPSPGSEPRASSPAWSGTVRRAPWWRASPSPAGSAVQVEAVTFAAAQAGDPVALEQLLVQLRPDIRRYARRQCHGSSAVDDVVQEELIVLYPRRGVR